MPEFDVPGHAQAFREAFGFKTMRDAGVTEVLSDLFDELCKLVPVEAMPFVHMGGDEVWDEKEKIDEAAMTRWAETVTANGRTVVTWDPGQRFEPKGPRIAMLWGDAQAQDCSGWFDARGWYIEDWDPFDALGAATYLVPFRGAPRNDRQLGAVFCAWHDNAVGLPYSRTFRNQPIFPCCVLLGNLYWHGGEYEELFSSRRLPLADDPRLDCAREIERRTIAQRDRVLIGLKHPFHFVRQTQMRWRMTDSDGRLVAKDIAQASVYPFNAPGSAQNFYHSPTGLVYVETWIRSPKEQDVGAWIGFTGYDRDHGRTRTNGSNAQGQWNKFGASIELNGTPIPPPVWEQPSLPLGERLDKIGYVRSIDEIPFTNDEWYMREPTPVHLDKGWNHVKMTLPMPSAIGPYSHRWIGTFMPVVGTTDHPREVEGLEYSSDPPSEEPEIRPPAVPLVTVDPHFSLWSAADRLYDTDTTFWAGAPQPLMILLEADGVTYRLCGRGDRFQRVLPVLPQIGRHVGATTTTYRFRNKAGLSAEVEFMTPRLTDNLDVFSRPVTYVVVRVRGAKRYRVLATISEAFATNDDGAEMQWSTNTVSGLQAVSVGRKLQTPFSGKGDWRRPDWGRAWLVGPVVAGDETHCLLAYDNVKSVRYFGSDLVDWWRRDGKSFETMLIEAELEFHALAHKCRTFDRKFAEDMRRVGGPEYAAIAELSWRQSFGACKFVAGPDGEPFLFSNENASGGMIGTTDVFYPQIPHLLLTSLTLAKASLAPTCIYAASTNWPYAYAPHDLGLFPVADGQFYGMKKGQSIGGDADDTSRMPVEECGNMLICLAAIAKAEGNADFAGQWWKEVRQWADYLVRFGYDPGNQLCTDDFAGHMAHNANLSVKSIMAIASFALMSEMRGETEAALNYRRMASEMARKWMSEAAGGARGSYRLAFDRPSSWSLKYNLVWDRLLDFNLFPSSVAEAEMANYRIQELDFGVPLDSRSRIAKADWIVWCGTLTGRRSDLEFMTSGLYRFLNRTPDRIPFSDCYLSDSGLQRSFIARSVVGGVFLPVLGHPDLVRTYRNKSNRKEK